MNKMLFAGIMACAGGILGVTIWENKQWNRIKAQLHSERPKDRWTDVKVRDVK